jgi:hypothetical protein
MNIAQIETIIHDASLGSGNPSRKQHATQLIDQMRLDPNRWSIGLQLFLYSASDVAKLFGLSCKSDCLSFLSIH